MAKRAEVRRRSALVEACRLVLDVLAFLAGLVVLLTGWRAFRLLADVRGLPLKPALTKGSDLLRN